MKNKILTAIAVMASLCGYAQTKGTNALSFGVNVNQVKTELNTTNGSFTDESKNSIFGLGYGLFIKDNTKLGVEFLYNTSESNNSNEENQSEGKGYGGNVTYQQYYPIVKKLYAYAGGKVAYQYSRLKYESEGFNDIIDNRYQLGAYGGVTWFFSKRFALETSLLSANVSYAKSNRDVGQNSSGYKQKSTSFNFSSQGFIDDLGFKIYLLF